MVYSPLSMVKPDEYYTRWVSIASSTSSLSSAFSSAHQTLKKTLYLSLYLNRVVKFFLVFLGIWMSWSPHILIRNVVFQFLHLSVYFENSPVSMVLLKHNQLLQPEQFVSKCLTFMSPSLFTQLKLPFIIETESSDYISYEKFWGHYPELLTITGFYNFISHPTSIQCSIF